MTKFPSKFTSKAIRLPIKDVDTDMIIPASFLTTTTKEGLGEHLFSNLRKVDPHFPLNNPEAQNARILIAGHNFGCGSSREHAPWALTDWGIQAVISSEFADIFKGNAEKNGLLPIVLTEEIVEKLLSQEDDFREITIDLENQTVITADGEEYPFHISEFSKIRFLEGLSDLDYLKKFEDKIRDFEQQRKERIPTLA